MHMFGHQYVGMQLHPVPPQRIAQHRKIELVIFILEKAGLAMIAALHHVRRPPGRYIRCFLGMASSFANLVNHQPS